MPKNKTVETRFHVQVFDDNGVPLKLRPMPLEEFQAFQDNHLTDHLTYEWNVVTAAV